MNFINLFNKINHISHKNLKMLMVGLTLCNTPSVLAKDIIDVYGIDAAESKQLMQKYASSIRDIELQLSILFDDSNHGVEHPKKLASVYQQKRKLLETIKQDGHYAFVDVQTVSYPDKSDIYSTVEIIPEHNSPRLKFVNHTIKSHQKPKHDLVMEMITYSQKVVRLMMNKQLNLKDECPTYHCAAPFTHPELKPYLALFNQGMQQHKKEVIDTLNHDSDPERRAAAAFLIGHLRDPHEIVTLLAPHVTDSNATVRNNVLRVIGETIWRAKINDIDARPYVALLDSPYVTDRNKSLIILFTIADSTSGKKQIAAEDQGRLEKLAQLKQPNNRDMAVRILQKLT